MKTAAPGVIEGAQDIVGNFDDLVIKFIRRMSADMSRNIPERALYLAGDNQPPISHALVHAVNRSLGNVGKTVFYSDPVDANPVNQTDSLKELVADMQAGKVDLLIILRGGNPAYEAPRRSRLCGTP